MITTCSLKTVDHCILSEAVVLPGAVDHCVLTVCVLSRAADHYVRHRLPGDDDDRLGQGLLDKDLHAPDQVVPCTDSQHPQVLDLLVLGLLDKELHTLGLDKFSTCLYRDYMMESCTPLVRLFGIR